MRGGEYECNVFCTRNRSSKKKDLLRGLEFCDWKNQLKPDFTFPYFKDGVTIKSGTTNLSIGD